MAVRCFGAFEVDLTRRELRRDAQPVQIGTRALDVLIALLSQPGAVVSARDLIAHAWPRTVANEANLRAQILALRRALDEGATGERYIQNVPGRGYRFTGRLVEPRDSVVSSAPQRPASVTVLGREAIIASLVERLPQQRLLTLVGAGGIGKTTVAHAVADVFGSLHREAVRWVDLGTLTDTGSAAEAIAMAIGKASCAGGPLLVVLDCADRLVEHVAPFAERIIRESAEVMMLVTSREALRAAGEYVVRLPPLALPPSAEGLTCAQALGFPAVQLFVDRAAAVLGGFTLRAADLPAVVRICRSLNGIALAIELAAGHLLAMSLDDLAGFLDARIRLAPVGRRTTLARHRTMHTVLEWSYEMLGEAEREVLLDLSAFEGEAGMTAIQAVASEGRRSTFELAQILARLVDKSLVTMRITPQGMAYGLLETTRNFALERLEELGRRDEVALRHAGYVLRALEALQANVAGLTAADGLEARRRELPDVRAALTWVQGSQAGAPLRSALSVAAARMFRDLGLLTDGKPGAGA